MTLCDMQAARQPDTGTEHLSVRVPRALKARLQAAADAEGLTLSHYCARLLETDQEEITT